MDQPHGRGKQRAAGAMTNAEGRSPSARFRQQAFRAEAQHPAPARSGTSAKFREKASIRAAAVLDDVRRSVPSNRDPHRRAKPSGFSDAIPQTLPKGMHYRRQWTGIPDPPAKPPAPSTPCGRLANGRPTIARGSYHARLSRRVIPQRFTALPHPQEDATVSDRVVTPRSSWTAP